MHLSPLNTHVGLLIRTWTRYSEPGQPRPHAEQGVYVRDSGFTRGTGGTAVHQTHYITRGPAIPNPGHLIRTRTRYSKPGLPHPHVNPLFRTRASSPTCGTEGLPAEQGAQPYTRPTTSHANPLFRTRAISSAREPAIPSLGNTAHMRNSGSTCGTGCLRAEQQRAVPHGAARLACLRAAHEHCGTARQRRRSAAESPGVMSLARATRSAAGSA